MQKTLQLALAAVVIVTQGCVAMQDDTVGALRKALPYAEARAALIDSGWKPVRHPRAEAGQRCGARTEICVTYPETESCSGTGKAFCLFSFADGTRALSVTTTGEEMRDMTVDSWKVAKK